MSKEGQALSSLDADHIIESARCGFEVLIRRIRSLEHDIEAYRGALGYPVRGDHDGRLSDGTTPINGIALARTYCPRCHQAMYP
jgi:hypothetical protein